MILFGTKGKPTYSSAEKPLPYDAEVEYLESTGTQWIDTGINLASTMIVKSAYQVFNDSDNNPCPFSLTLAVGRRYSVITSNRSTSILLDSGSSSVAGYYIANDEKVHMLEFDVSGMQTLYFDGAEVSSRGRAFTAVAGRTVKLFVQSSTTAQVYGYGRVISFSVSDTTTGQKIQDLIPVRVGTVGYMYDRVSGNLFGNDGTGSFIVGRDINPISTRSYVNDGLVAMWDGIENAGWGVHDAAVTTWKDLTGNGYDIAIPSSGAVWGDDKISLAATSLSTDLPQVNRTEFTIECVATGTADGSYVWMKNPSWIGGALVGQGISFALWYPWAPVGVLGVPTWSAKNSISLTWKQSEQAGYLNGQKMLTSTGSIDGRNVLSKIYIGEYNGSKCTTLDGYHFRLYSRALTDAEIAANYAIDKARFNLP